MSSEFTSNESTPLRQPDINLLQQQQQQLQQQQQHQLEEHLITHVNNNNNNNNSNQILLDNNSDIDVAGISVGGIGNYGGRTTSLSFNSNSYINYNNNNNNNNQEQQQQHHRHQDHHQLTLDYDQQYHNQQQLHHIHHYSERHFNKMDVNRRMFWKVTLDFLILLCVGFPILFFYLFGEPYKRGFFCDDESLRHPFLDSTVKNYMLYIIGLVMPICIILTTEHLHARSDLNKNYRFMDWDIPTWMVGAYKQIGVFGFGAASQQLIVDIAKYSIGRLRPHFFDVCQPVMPDNTTCLDPINFNRYIEEFTCLGNSTPRMLKEMRLSFPSGHSSFSTYTMIYMAIYLHSRMQWRSSKLLKHFIQFLLFCIAWFTSLSRISNYKHHWSDVLSGAVIGVIFAIIVSQFVSDFVKPNVKKSYLPDAQHTTIPMPQSQHDQVVNYNNHHNNGQHHHHHHHNNPTNGHGYA